MPHLVYLSNEDTFFRRLLHHPERIVAAWWAIIGADFLVGFSSHIGSIPWRVLSLTGVACVFLIMSGILIVLTNFRKSDSKAWRLERQAWIWGGGGWLVYFVALAFYVGVSSFMMFSIPAVMLALSVARLVALGRTEQTIRRKAGA